MVPGIVDFSKPILIGQTVDDIPELPWFIPGMHSELLDPEPVE